MFIDHLIITTRDTPAIHPVYAAICGGDSTSHTAEDGTARFTRFYLSNSVVELAEPVGHPHAGTGGILHRTLNSRGPGVQLICLPSNAPDSVAMELEKVSARVLYTDEHLYVHPRSANGVLVQLTPRPESNPPSQAGDARIDHIAIAVKNLAQAEVVWSRITGVEGTPMGIHPVSNGRFEATRYLMGDQMIELLSPVDGVASPMAERLADRGEGTIAVALPADDLAKTLERIKQTGARLIKQDPHWMVHPKDTGGVLIQLTPRVNHSESSD